MGELMYFKKIKIGIFATSELLYDQIQQIAQNNEDEIHVVHQSLDDAIPLGKKMEKDGIEVIISRRGTTYLLREKLHIPVLSFPHRSLEILVSCRQAANLGRKILLPAFSERLSEIEIIEDMLNVKILQEIYHNFASLEQIIWQAKKKGCEVVLGGSVTQKIAESNGLKCVDIKTSNDDIIATIESAKSVVRSNREQKTRARRYRYIIDSTSDGIIAVDEEGFITTINSAALQHLGITNNDRTRHLVTEYIPDYPIVKMQIEKAPIHNCIYSIDSENYIFNHKPILFDNTFIGAVSSFKSIGNVMKTENVVRKSLSKGLSSKYKLEDLVYSSTSMYEAVMRCQSYAQTDSTILVMGETGTGKEILVQGIHDVSDRSNHPFVSVNCAALPEQLLESELFGYEEGAFTGSKKGGKPGLFEISHKGTIFLDEIDSTPEAVQLRLLRVLQEREVLRIGGDRKIPVDVRVIAAASHDLNLAIRVDRFRKDLFFRLNVLRIQIPPLRERKDDIPILLEFFIKYFSKRYVLEPISLPALYVEKLMEYTWPGNVRELKNFSERLVLNCCFHYTKDIYDVLYKELIEFPTQENVRAKQLEPVRASKDIMRDALRQNEKDIILNTLERANYKKSKAAQLLGISRATLWRKMKNLDLNSEL